MSRTCTLLGFLAATLPAAEPDALALEANLLRRPLPYGTVLNPILAGGRTVVAGYTRCGDPALRTGHYLAAGSRHRTRTSTAVFSCTASVGFEITRSPSASPDAISTSEPKSSPMVTARK